MPADSLSLTFAALADPTRRAILAQLTDGEAAVTELARPFDISLPAVTRHLKVLERAGLISRGRQAQWRPCRLRAQPLHDAADWVQQYRAFWEQRFDQLETYLRETREEETGSPHPAAKPGRAAARTGGERRHDRRTRARRGETP